MSSEPERAPPRRELRAAYEAELKRLRVEHVLLDNVVALANLGMRRTGLAPGTEDERDPAQVRLRDRVRSARLLPLLEQAAPHAGRAAIRDAVSQLQLALRDGSAGQAAAAPSAAGKRWPGGGAGAAVRRGSAPPPSRAPAQARRAGAGAAQRPALGPRPVARRRGQQPDVAAV